MNACDTFSLPAKTKILTGKELADWLVCSHMPKDIRKAYRYLQTYIQGEYPDHVCVLNGLSGTGKKSLMRRAMLELPTDQTAYINIKEGEKSGDLVALVSEMIEKHNITYFFIVNITRMENFIGVDELLANYCNHSVRIIITGDSNLAICISNKKVYIDQYGNEFLPKIYTIDTTKISYNEHVMMTGNYDLENYIMTSGTCPTEDKGVSGKTIFEQDKLAKSYVSTAFVSNIIVGADAEKHCGTHYSMVRSLQGSKTVINNIINNIVCSMVYDAIGNKFTDKNISFDTKEKYCIKSTSSSEILHALRMIGAISSYKNSIFSGCWESQICLHLTQPGLCYWIAEKYVCDHFSEKNTEQILLKIRERILEDMILFWCLQSKKYNSVSKLEIGKSGGKAILVHEQTDSKEYSLYEIVHSTEMVQPLIINNESLCLSIEKRFGKIMKKAIIGEGEYKLSNNIECYDVRQFLTT